jgi:hypothetical protein
MSVLHLTPPPTLGPDARYPEYKPWLLANFHRDLCSYCLQQYQNALSIDHYVPQSHDKEGIHDPKNLLLSCQNCGRQKWDYHPDHESRRRLPDDVSGFLALDVRRDDLALIFDIDADGALVVRPNLDPRECRRAVWNVATLLRLDLYDEQRARLLEKLRLVEQLRAVDGELTDLERQTLAILEPELAERLPMLRAFDIAITAELDGRLKQLAAALIER